MGVPNHAITHIFVWVFHAGKTQFSRIHAEILCFLRIKHAIHLRKIKGPIKLSRSPMESRYQLCYKPETIQAYNLDNPLKTEILNPKKLGFNTKQTIMFQNVLLYLVTGQNLPCTQAGLWEKLFLKKVFSPLFLVEKQSLPP